MTGGISTLAGWGIKFDLMVLAMANLVVKTGDVIDLVFLELM